jgi:hypothetical protein
MDIAGDRRAQSVQVGVVILFGFLVLAFAGYQATVVPQQNGEVEFNHFEEVETQVSELRSDAMDAAADERSRSVDVDLGTRYPARSIAVNPSPVSGSLRTSNVGAVEVNSLGTDASALCSDSGASPIESRSVVYRPNYNQYREARNVTFENTFVARGFQNGNRYGPQSLVVPDADGTTEINLQVLTGSLSGSGEETRTVNLYPSRTFEQTFSVTSQFSIVVPSRVPPSEWEDELLSEAIDQGVVVDVTDADDGDTDRVRIHFDPVSDYAVSCSVVGLNAQPAYVPPSSSGSAGSGGPGSGDGAYATVWQSPAGQTGTSSCNEEDCTFDAGAGGTLTLTADTEPTADDTDVVFAVNNTSVATVTPETDTTGPEGEASTDLTPITDGVVKVYASSGGSGDAINVTVTNAGGAGAGQVVFEDQDDDVLRTTDGNGGLTTISTSHGDITALGPSETDYTGDGTADVPFVENNRLYYVNASGSPQVVDSSGVVDGSRLGIGDWDGDLTVEVTYVRNGYLWQVEYGESPEPLCQNGNTNCSDAQKYDASAVSGVGDYATSVVGNELVYVDSSDAIRYVNTQSGGSIPTGATVETANAVSPPADFNNDGALEVAYVDNTQSTISLVNSSGPAGQITGINKAGYYSLGAMDWKGSATGTPAVIYVETGANKLYYADATDGSNGKLTNENGQDEKAKTDSDVT